jgi:aldehyde dehydrogenase (NAD+)
VTRTPIETGRLFIAGEWREAEGRETLPLENPSDGSLLARITRGGAKDVDRAVAAAREAL